MVIDSTVLYTNDIDRIARFYNEIVGLSESYRYPQYVSFTLDDGSKLGINKSIYTDREIPGHQTVFLAVDNIKEEYERYRSLGYDFYEEYKENDWGTYFAILDPDGNKIGYIKRPN